ncbi:hypothetical protein Tsubulata_015609, partial [Turnera subulata]
MWMTLYVISGMALFYTALGCCGYAGFGTKSGNVLTAFNKPLWLVEFNNIPVIIHLIVGYMVFSQSIFAINEKRLATKWPNSFFTVVYTVRVPFTQNETFPIIPCRLLIRITFVIFTILVAIADFPLSMYIVQARIRQETFTWTMLQ